MLLKRVSAFVLVLAVLTAPVWLRGQTTSIGIPANDFAPPVMVIPASAVNGAGTIAIGSGGATATVGGTLFSSVTAASTTGTIEETLIQYTLPANTLAVNTRGVRIRAWGVGAANANAKTGKVYFGATAVGTTTSVFASGNSWIIDATVLRSGAATQVAIGFANVANNGYNTFTNTTPAETLSGAVIIKVTGTTAVSAGDLTANALTVEAL